ncbi:hypothetical protein BAUCODRAFT_32696 [Baudoinia panamericana UAMH 10762]|uniref:Uncharacterized protein n=1 Tax=Baudoinia panamericana (strain UAMH 10762) TaxID=717646 RepID=M2NDG1_BAUPA|nr:uncharacterized protein BAUCODRAFT_32696 [Baudoinia panamericana UAMH 10762]EMC96950.1 hypothetical protein BAUCODRAFT_32696 [Baudoinia panamericana UAMH 10762]
MTTSSILAAHLPLIAQAIQALRLRRITQIRLLKLFLHDGFAYTPSVRETVLELS